MDWFWQWYDVFQKSGAYATLQKFSTGDWILIFALLWGMAIGIKKGASEMFGKVFGLFLTGVIVLTFYRNVSASMTAAVPVLPLEVAHPVSFVLVLGFSWFSIIGCVNLLGKFFHVESHGALRTFGGMFFGAVYFLLLISLICQFLLFIPSGGLQRSFSKEHSFSGPIVVSIFPTIQRVVVAPFQKNHHLKAVRPGKTSAT